MLAKLNHQLINYLKNHYKNILIFMIIFFIVTPIFLEKNISDLDELWNYNFAKNIADGLVPYRDFNMLQTPLLPFIAGFILKIFGNELIVMRIFGIFLISFIFYMIYKIFKLIKINSAFIFLSFFFIFILLKNYLCIDYNFSVLALTLLIIYLEIKYYQKKESILSFYFFDDLLIGLLAGCCILLKQSTGFLISAMAIGFKLLMVKNKNDFQLFLKIAFTRILGIFIPVLLLIIYLIFNHAFHDFINYTILGIKTFTNKIPYTSLVHSNYMIIKILSIFIPIFLLISTICVIKKKNVITRILFFYSIGSLIVIYPISDNIHFLIGITPSILLFLYFIFNLLNSKIKKYNKNNLIIFMREFLKATMILLCIFFTLTEFIKLIHYISSNKDNFNFSHFNYIPMSEEQYNRIHLVDSYILSQNNPVYILDADAALYMIPIDRYYKDFNLFLKGNLGEKDEDGQIEKINHLASGSQILIKNNNYKRNWQTPEKVISYIQNNFHKIGEISLFNIYEK